jgi:hypothetical protein
MTLRKLSIRDVSRWESFVAAIKDMKRLEEITFSIEKNVSIETSFILDFVPTTSFRN